jgi:REP element-mobilizing transposase RayT
MSRPLRIEFAGAFYHVTSRGNERKAVYRSQRDREKFLSYLESATERYGAVVHVYCLMINHYHLLLETPSGNLSQIMHHINSAYTTYFNTKHARSGHLFQGRYKSIVVDADEYAIEVSRYIHLNPVRNGLAKYPEEYEWSSCQYYICKREIPKWLKRSFILSYFGRGARIAMKKYRNFVHSVLEKDCKNPLARLSHPVILGEDEFIEEIKRRYLRGKQPDRELPTLKDLSDRPSLSQIERAVDAVLPSEKKLSRQVKLHLCHRLSGMKLKEIGKYFGIGESGVTYASRRVGIKSEKDKKLREKIKIIESKIILSKV